MNFRNFLVAGVAVVALSAQPVLAGAVITTGSTSLGVNDSAELNFFGNGPGGSGIYGVFREGVGDAISPGCLCEGWGVSTIYGGLTTSGFANRNAGSGGLTGGTFSSSASQAVSTIGLANAPLRITHAYGPSLAPDTFQVNVTVTNLGTNLAQDLTYRRVMDWDVPPTTFREFVTHSGVTANLLANGGAIKYASNNGFASSNPLIGGTFLNSATVNTDFVANGPSDHGSLFDFSFGDLAAGSSRLFSIFYGSAATIVDALANLSTVGANVYSLGQNSTSDGVNPGTPATFFFGFGGVGGVETGTTAENPVLPIVELDPITKAPIFEFPAPVSGRWYDPPFADGFVYALTGGATFEKLIAPPLSLGFAGPFTLSSGGTALGTISAGGEFLFGSGISSFTLSGIAPGIDFESPGFSTAFPAYLEWTGTASALTVTPTFPAGSVFPGGGGSGTVPEPDTWALFIIGFGVVGVTARRRRAAVSAA